MLPNFLGGVRALSDFLVALSKSLCCLNLSLSFCKMGVWAASSQEPSFFCKLWEVSGKRGVEASEAAAMEGPLFSWPQLPSADVAACWGPRKQKAFPKIAF